MVIPCSMPRFPCSIVWTPIPLLSWILPWIGHIGICTSEGKIYDYGASFYVREDDMAFGEPTKYWYLNPDLAKGGIFGWDMAVRDASDIYSRRVHNLCFDNCHSHVALALNLMAYENRYWNAFKVGFHMFFYGKYVSKAAWMKTWFPFLLLLISAVCVISWNQFHDSV